jgi:hypothetical protein
MKTFGQQEYNEVNKALDDALAVFRDTTDTEEAAEAAFKSFVNGHYFSYWRAVQKQSVKEEV